MKKIVYFSIVMLFSLLPLASRSQDTIHYPDTTKYMFNPILSPHPCEDIEYGIGTQTGVPCNGTTDQPSSLSIRPYFHNENERSPIVYGVAFTMDNMYPKDSYLGQHWIEKIDSIMSGTVYLYTRSSRNYPDSLSIVIVDSTPINFQTNTITNNFFVYPVPGECVDTTPPYDPWLYDSVQNVFEVYFNQMHLMSDEVWVGVRLCYSSPQLDYFFLIRTWDLDLGRGGYYYNFFDYGHTSGQYSLDLTDPLNGWGGFFPIIAPPPCIVPQIDSVEAHPDWAFLQWPEPINTDRYRLVYGPEGFDPTTSDAIIIDNIYNNYAILTNLTEGTAYDVYLQGYCDYSNDTLSDASFFSFSTPLLCDTLSDLHAEQILEQSALLVCQTTPTTAFVQAEYGEPGFEPGTGILMDNLSVAWGNRCWIHLDSLQPNTTYTVRSRSYCSEVQAFSWWSETTFTTDGPKFTITANVNDETMGHVEGAGIYPAGQQVSLSAVPNDNIYQFDSWEDGSVQNPRIITLTQDTTVLANFSLISDNPDDSTGIASPSALTAKVHPNPVHGLLTIEMSQPNNYMVQLYDAQGRQLYSYNQQGSLLTLDMTPYPTGHYLLRLSSPSASTTLSVVKE